MKQECRVYIPDTKYYPWKEHLESTPSSAPNGWNHTTCTARRNTYRKRWNHSHWKQTMKPKLYLPTMRHRPIQLLLALLATWLPSVNGTTSRNGYRKIQMRMAQSTSYRSMCVSFLQNVPGVSKPSSKTRAGGERTGGNACDEGLWDTMQLTDDLIDTSQEANAPQINEWKGKEARGVSHRPVCHTSRGFWKTAIGWCKVYYKNPSAACQIIAEKRG